MITPLWAIIAPVFSIADRGIGGALKRSQVIGSLLILILITFFSGSIVPASLIATWVVYRTLPWSFGGTLTPRTAFQIIGSFLRHSMPAFAALGLYAFGLVNAIPALSMIIYALYATLLAKYYADSVDKIASGKGDAGFKHLKQVYLNNKIEIFRGISFSIAFALSVIFGVIK